MIDRETPVTEEELHAYVDGELPADRREAVGAWLAANPEQAALVAAWRTQADSIRARYGDVVNAPVPELLQLDQIIKNDLPYGRSRGRTVAAMATAAALVAFIVGGGAGWYARAVTMTTPAVFDRFTAEALDAYRLYVVEVRHPVEVAASERAHLQQWLSKRVGYDIKAPDLDASGLKLVGGRLLPGPSGPAAFFMYETASGERFTIFTSRAKGDATQMRYASNDNDGALFWADRGVGYVVSGPTDKDRLTKVARLVYDQTESKAL